MRSVKRKPCLYPLILGMMLFLIFPAAACGQRLPDKPDDRFYACLESLILKHGNNQKNWPDSREKRILAEYLKNVHALDLNEVIFARNFLGMGVGNSPGDARKEMGKGQTDAWGVPYDLIIASSRGEPGKMDILKGIFINQGMGLYNKELSENTYVVLKADLHSQFGDVFKNFNGISARIIAREVNFLGCPGSEADDYPDQIKPALTAADALVANIYLGDKDKVTMIIPEMFSQMAESLGLKLPVPGARRKPMGPMKAVTINRIKLKDCSHALKDYQNGMRKSGPTLILPQSNI